jgi:hypothetical protein
MEEVFVFAGVFGCGGSGDFDFAVGVWFEADALSDA